MKDLSRQRLLDPVGSMVNVEKEEKKSKFETKSCPPLFSTTFLGKKGVRTKLSKSNLVNQVDPSSGLLNSDLKFLTDVAEFIVLGSFSVLGWL